jgi:uncharacterized protein (TIGR02145 family)
MKKIILATAVIIALAITTSSNAQVGIGVSTAERNQSAQLDVTSTTKGFLPPRMTEVQRNLVPVTSASAGLTIWCTNCGVRGELQVYDGVTWTNLVGAAAAADLTPRVTIGAQVWATQNLNVSNYRDGTPIPRVDNATIWASLTTGAYCYYNNDSATYAAVYGKLYNWYAVAGIYDASSLNTPSLRKNLAPAGYKIPTDGDWTTLELTLGADAGTQMKSTSGWNNGNNGTNSSGFAGLPGGSCEFSGSFVDIGDYGNLWSSTEHNTADAWARILFDYSPSYLTKVPNGKSNGFSVRCLRDY